ncbi:MAG: hypothetical protein NZ889_01885 [Candidatus Pacearchaeota archaeon]|nr:hypothetical protein [Candidatus Pacearchaeota archaeon]
MKENKKEWLHVNFVFEAIGRPKEHITEMLQLLVKKLGESKKVEVLKSKLHEAKPIERKENSEKIAEVYSSFVEVEALVESMTKLMGIIFDFMPSSIEIVSPIDLKMKAWDANALLNDLATKLHYYNMALNALKAERDMLSMKLSKSKQNSKY